MKTNTKLELLLILYLSVSSSAQTCSISDDLNPIRREEFDGGRIVDITHFYREDMPYGDSPDRRLGQFLWLPTSMKNGSLYNGSVMKLPAHAGTHVDAPGHVFQEYFEAGFDIDTLDLAVLNGPALLVDVPRNKNITAEVMESLHIPRGVRRVLFRTLNTDRQLMWKKEFDTSYVGFMKDGAQWLVDNTDIKLVGIDYLSVAAFDDLIPSHLVFLEGREIILVEALKLEDVMPGLYSLHCLPLRLRGAEGSPISKPSNIALSVEAHKATLPILDILQSVPRLAPSSALPHANLTPLLQPQTLYSISAGHVLRQRAPPIAPPRRRTPRADRLTRYVPARLTQSRLMRPPILFITAGRVGGGAEAGRAVDTSSRTVSGA
ncbi:uncharacterized protein A4U43_C05F32450 [Asparagus officinalis]|uniref:Cyclase family protein n=1 Tax=Asparagus officinalis TaxID=4686 RepID=A0A5P1EWU0_ASPOF|nr:uncharacterized protein A4U43_C05F32450 [Asparagus officinalis]